MSRPRDGARGYLWVGALTIVMILIALSSALIARHEGIRETTIREKAQRILIDRAGRLQRIPVKDCPPRGVFGPEDLTPRMAGLLSPVGPVAFRLQVTEDDDRHRLFLRLVAHWGGGDADVVVVRFHRPLALEVES